MDLNKYSDEQLLEFIEVALAFESLKEDFNVYQNHGNQWVVEFVERDKVFGDRRFFVCDTKSEALLEAVESLKNG